MSTHPDADEPIASDVDLARRIDTFIVFVTYGKGSARELRGDETLHVFPSGRAGLEPKRKRDNP